MTGSGKRDQLSEKLTNLRKMKLKIDRRRTRSETKKH